MRLFSLTISRVDETLFAGEAESVTVPSTSGELTLLAGHMPLIASLKAGEIVVRREGEPLRIPITRGVIEVHQGGGAILLD